MVLVRFEYLRSDSERKLLIGQIQLDTCQIRKPRHVQKLSSVADGSQRNFLFAQNWGKIFQRWKSGHLEGYRE